MSVAGTGVGVVLVNLGTPEDPSLPAVQRYLREFLTDRRIIPLNPLLWRPILEFKVLQVHARSSAEKYAAVWTEAGSPLMVHATAQTTALAAELGPGIAVATAMRYGNPSLGSVLDRFAAEGINRVLIVPMYPQFSVTTVATVMDALASHIRARHNQLEYRTVRDFHADSGYIEACARLIERNWAEHGRPDFAAGDRLLLSYHGIPVQAVASGDTYPQECEATSRLLRERLGLGEGDCVLTYQSKFGRGEWLTPATIEEVARLASSGVKRLDVFCPGFVADCLETEEEIALLNRDEFLAHGGQAFHRVPCLNSDPDWIRALAALVGRHLAGWIQTSVTAAGMASTEAASQVWQA